MKLLHAQPAAKWQWPETSLSINISSADCLALAAKSLVTLYVLIPPEALQEALEKVEMDDELREAIQKDIVACR